MQFAVGARLFGSFIVDLLCVWRSFVVALSLSIAHVCHTAGSVFFSFCTQRLWVWVAPQRLICKLLSRSDGNYYYSFQRLTIFKHIIRHKHTSSFSSAWAPSTACLWHVRARARTRVQVIGAATSEAVVVVVVTIIRRKMILCNRVSRYSSVRFYE